MVLHSPTARWQCTVHLPFNPQTCRYVMPHVRVVLCAECMPLRIALLSGLCGSAVTARVEMLARQLHNHQPVRAWPPHLHRISTATPQPHSATPSSLTTSAELRSRANGWAANPSRLDGPHERGRLSMGGARARVRDALWKLNLGADACRVSGMCALHSDFYACCIGVLRPLPKRGPATCEEQRAAVERVSLPYTAGASLQNAWRASVFFSQVWCVSLQQMSPPDTVPTITITRQKQ
eukprot:5852566-Amphidinium_carterae.1